MLAASSQNYWRRVFFSDGAVIGLCLFFAFFFNLWGVPLFDLDEGAFAEATREMLASGNFAATYLDGIPRYDKPILSYWFQALSVTMFGQNEFGFRLPSALAASLWLIASYRFVKQKWDQRTALVTVLIMANVAIVGVVGRAATADAWLNLFISLAMFDMWRYMQAPKSSTLVATYTWLALGVLTKGPVAIAIPFITAAIFFISNKQHLLFYKAISNPLGWLVLFIILGPWLIAVYQDQGWGFFSGFLLDHNVNRFTQTREGHGGYLFYYLAVLPIIILPFTGAMIKLTTHLKSIWRDDLSRYFLIWFGVVFFLVSLSQTQLPHYLLYGLPGIFLLLARYRDVCFRADWSLSFPLAFMALMLFLPEIVAFAADSSTRPYEEALLLRGSEILNAQYRLLTAITLATMICIIFLPRISHLKKFILLGALQTFFIFNVLAEAVGELQQGPVKRAALLANQLGYANVVAYDISMPSFSVYRQSVTPRDGIHNANLIFTRIDKLRSLERKLGNEIDIVYREGGILLVERRNEYE